MSNPSFMFPVGRFSETIANGASAYLTEVFDCSCHGVVAVSLASDRALTLTFLHGTEADAATALPHGADKEIEGVPLGEGAGSDYFFKVPAGTPRGRIKATNSSGGLATVVADTGLSYS